MPLTEAIMRQLLDSIETVVGADGPWSEKRDQIMEACSADQETALIEFSTWFEGIDDTPENNGVNGEDDDEGKKEPHEP
jgi:hypothetical protein